MFEANALKITCGTNGSPHQSRPVDRLAEIWRSMYETVKCATEMKVTEQSFFFSTSKMTISLPSINEPCDGSFKLLSQCFHVLLTVDWFRIRKNLVSTETYKALQELNPWTSIRSCFCFIELWDQRDQNRNLLVSAAVVFFSDWEHKVDKE